jgi:phosphatidylglycerophosphate synthase
LIPHRGDTGLDIMLDRWSVSCCLITVLFVGHVVTLKQAIHPWKWFCLKLSKSGLAASASKTNANTLAPKVANWATPNPLAVSFIL